MSFRKSSRTLLFAAKTLLNTFAMLMLVNLLLTMLLPPKVNSSKSKLILKKMRGHAPQILQDVATVTSFAITKLHSAMRTNDNAMLSLKVNFI